MSKMRVREPCPEVPDLMPRFWGHSGDLNLPWSHGAGRKGPWAQEAGVKGLLSCAMTSISTMSVFTMSQSWNSIRGHGSTSSPPADTQEEKKLFPAPLYGADMHTHVHKYTPLPSCLLWPVPLLGCPLLQEALHSAPG